MQPPIVNPQPPFQPGGPYNSYPPQKSRVPVIAIVLGACACVGFFGIIILAAILFPVFAQAREAARTQSCLSNEKQMALGALMYAQDYDEIYPGSENWMDKTSAYLKSTGGGALPATGSPDTMAAYHCPSVVPAGSPDYETQFGYAYNDGISGVKISEVAAPAETLLLYDSTDLSRNAHDAGTSAARDRHVRGCNVAHADAHVRWYPEDATLPLASAKP